LNVIGVRAPISAALKSPMPGSWPTSAMCVRFEYSFSAFIISFAL